MLHEAPSKNYEIYKSDGSTPLSSLRYCVLSACCTRTFFSHFSWMMMTLLLEKFSNFGYCQIGADRRERDRTFMLDDDVSLANVLNLRRHVHFVNVGIAGEVVSCVETHNMFYSVLRHPPAPLVTSSNVQKRNRAPKRHRYIFPHYWVSEDQLGLPPSLLAWLALTYLCRVIVSLSFRCKTMHYHSTKAARCSDYSSYALSFCSVHIKESPPDLGTWYKLKIRLCSSSCHDESLILKYKLQVSPGITRCIISFTE